MRIRKTNPSQVLFAKEIVDAVIGDSNQSQSRTVNLETLAKQVGVVDISVGPLPVEGFVVSTEAGLVIYVNSKSSKARQRFTIAHEIGHILLARYENKSIGVKCRSTDFSTEEEQLVDMIAAEILMPSDELQAYLNGFDNAWDAVDAIMESFDVSVTAATIRLMSVSGTHGVWFTANEFGPNSMSICLTKTISRIVDPFKVWNSFCWKPLNRQSRQVYVLENSSEEVEINAHLRIMYKMDAKTNSKPNNLWILGWGMRTSTMQQLRFDF